jgi:hypothetical protein
VIGTLHEGGAFGALLGLAGIVFGAFARGGARREEEYARRVRELEGTVAQLQDEKSEDLHRIGVLESRVDTLTAQNESMRRALRRRAEENNGG